MPESKLVVITGCTRGLGRAMAAGFAARGWTLAGCTTNSAAIEALQAELGTPHRFLSCDVSDASQVRSFADEITSTLGPPDLLINNPGIIDTDMLCGCFGTGADGFPSAEQWARSAVPFLAELGPSLNGRPLSAPGA